MVDVHPPNITKESSQMQQDSDAATISRLLRAKLSGTVTAIEALSSEERLKQPMSLLGEDINRMRALIKDHLQNLEPFLPPEALVWYRENERWGYTRQTYSELLTYCHQMLQLVNTHFSSQGK